MPSIQLTVNHEAGLHARPMALFVKTAKQFNADITVKNLTRGEGPVNGKSPLKILLLAVSQGHQIEITTEGEDGDQALEALKTLVESNFEVKEDAAS